MPAIVTRCTAPANLPMKLIPDKVRAALSAVEISEILGTDIVKPGIRLPSPSIVSFAITPAS